MPPFCVTIIQLYGGNRTLYGGPIESLSFIGKKAAAEAVIMHIYSVVSHQVYTERTCVIQSSWP